MRKKIIVDLDKTIFYSEYFDKFLPDSNTRESWDLFHKNVNYYKDLDFNKDMVKMLSLLNKEYDILFVTARENDKTGNILINTIDSLNKACPDIPVKLYMRDCNDFRTSNEVKEDLFLKHYLNPEDIAFVLDDNVNNIEMYKKYNITTFLIQLNA